MRRKAMFSLLTFVTVASLLAGCGESKPAPQPQSGEPPSATMTDAGKLKAGSGPKGK